jgi:hypothetical protein
MSCITGIFVFVFTCIVSFLLMALAVGTCNAWILEGTFSDGWAAAFDRWLVTIGFGLLFLGGGASARSSK